MDTKFFDDRINNRIKDIEQQIAILEAELTDLRTAVRVIKKLENEKTPFGGFQLAVASFKVQQHTIAYAVLEKLQIHGPMESSAILSELQRTWRPNLVASTLLSTLSRMKAAGRIMNKGRRWMLPQTEEALSSSQLDNASKSDVVEVTSLNNIND